MSYKLTKIWLALYLWFQKSGTVLYMKDIVRAVPFLPKNIAWALIYFSSKGKGVLKYKVKLPDGEIPDEIWNSPLDIPDNINKASDVLPVFVKN